MMKRILALSLTVVMLAAMLATGITVTAAADPLYEIYINDAYLVDADDCSGEVLDFWDYDYGNRTAYNDIGGEGYGFVDKAWSSGVTKQKVLDEPIALGGGAVVLGFDAYVKDFNNGTLSLAVDTNPDIDWTANEIYSSNRYFTVLMENGNIGLGHSGGGTGDTNKDSAMTALWGQGRTPFGEDSAWKHYDFVIDMVYGYTAVYCEGELILKAGHPIESFTAFQVNLRNNGYNSDQQLYLDNYKLYRVPASALRNLNAVSEYTLAKNRIDYSIGVLGSAGVEGTEADLWTSDLNHYPRYKTAADAANNAFYDGELAAGLPPVLYGSVDAAAYGSHYPVKAFDDVYRNGEGYFTFSYDYFANSDVQKILYLELYQQAAPTGYDSSARTRVFAQDSGVLAVGNPANTGGSTGVVDMPYGQWYHMDVVVDMVNNKITVYQDGEVLVETNAVINSIYGLCAEMKNRDGSSCNTAFYLDNFAMYWTPNPVFTVKTPVVYKDGEPIDGISSIAAGDALTAAVELVNNTEEAKDYMLSVVVYNGNVQKDMSFVESTLASGEKITPTLDFEVASTEDLKIKVFVWDSMESMIPYIKGITL